MLRYSLRHALNRTYSTVQKPFVPPAQLHNIEAELRSSPKGRSRKGRGRREEEDGGQVHWEPETTKFKPESPSFYTGRPVYYDQVIQLQTAISHARSALKTLQLFPLPTFARDRLPPLRPVWKDQDEMTADFQSKMTTARYRQVTTLLNELNDYLRIATAAQCTDLIEGIGHIIAMFESGKKDAFLARGRRKKVCLDGHGRSYTIGKRKTSSARVWMIPVNIQSSTVTQTPEESLEEIFDLPKSAPQGMVTTTTVLVNNIPLAEYFPIPADRERIIRPLKVTGALGAYNIFSIVRGGGTTGQSGALAHGISKGLIAHAPELEAILRKAKLVQRDPRMVERKKTGLAKARKRYAWVKR